MSGFSAPVYQWLYQGLVAAGGSVKVYQTGTTTYVTIYVDAALTTPAANPLTLDANGQCKFYTAGTTAIRMDGYTQAGAFIQSIDPVYPVGPAGAIQCTENGTNIMVLSPLTGQPSIAAYANYQEFGFVKTVTTTGSVTCSYGSLATLNVYRSDGNQAGSGDFVNGIYYKLVYNSALNSSAGGFQIISATPAAAAASAGPSGANSYATAGTYTFTAPVGTLTSTLFKITLTAGGAAGAGGTGGSVGGGSGGGAGATSFWYLSNITAGTTFTLLVGAGGIGTTTTGGAGANSVVTVGSQSVTAYGGQTTSNGNNANGGIGGSGGTYSGAAPNYFAVAGGGGASGYAANNSAGSGIGGASWWGGGAPSVGSVSLATSNGVNATSPGAGGSGAWGSTTIGGNGKDGLILIEYGGAASGGSGGSTTVPPIIQAGNPNVGNISGVTGQSCFDSTDGYREYIYTGGVWKVVALPTLPNGWNPYTVGGATLSASNTVATAAGSDYNYGQMYAWPPKQGGKRYFEITPPNTNFSVYGLASYPTNVYGNVQGGQFNQNPLAGHLTWTTGGTVGVAIDTNNTFTIGTAAGWSGGNTLCFAVDLDAQTIWVRTNGGNWNNSGAANPDTNTGGFSMVRMGLLPWVPGGNNGGAGNTVINLGTSAFAQTKPTTFTSWIA